MRKYINEYISDFESALNVQLMNKSADRPLVEYVIESWKSLEIVRNIKIIKFEYTDSESEIDINKYIFKREKKKKKRDRVDYKFINDDRYGKLTVHIQITVEGIDPTTKEPSVHRKIIKKEMLIPLQDDDGYYMIRGKRYYIIYQLVEKSTYTSSSAVTLKSLMPVAVKRNSLRAENFVKNNTAKKDIHGTEYLLPVYNVFVFKKEVPIILFYAANGMDWGLSYLGVDNIIKFVDNPDLFDTDKNIYFAISTKCYIEVNKQIFMNQSYVQSIVGGLLYVCTNRLTVDDMNNKSIWIKKLSNNNTIEKGEDILIFFTRLMDETTKTILKLNTHNKEDIYAILRWMMQNYNTLRMKDNLSLENKRLRCNEYIASLLTLEFSKRLNRVITLGQKATMDNYLECFKFSGELLLQKMHSAGILRFDDTINDMDFFSRFKYTNKGPHSMGGKNANNISIRYRGIHPSFLGNIDLLVCGNSDPGTSGVLSPFGKIDGFYFNNSKEPDDYEFDIKKDLSKLFEEEGVEYIQITCDNKDDYYRILDDISEFNKTSIKVSGTSRNAYQIVIENEDSSDQNDDLDDDIPEELIEIDE